MIKKRILLTVCILLIFLCGCGGREDLYLLAMEDAKVAEESEILPLVTLTPDSPMVTWNGDGTKVLLLSMHRYPESYVAGEEFTCIYGEIWTFTDAEIRQWYDENHEGVTDWPLRLKQLLGVPESKEYTHVSAFWVELDEVIRPAYQLEVTEQMTPDLLDGSALGGHKPWFDEYAELAYSDETPYPWTRLGYTYDWADNGRDYGLTEFLILADSVIEVEWTKTVDEFILWLEEN